MERPEKMLIAVDADALSRIEEKLDALLQFMTRAKIQASTEWVTVSHAAQIMEVSAETIRRWIRAGKLEAKGAGKARQVKIR